jgi:lysophospholipase L1-like esterase
MNSMVGGIWRSRTASAVGCQDPISTIPDFRSITSKPNTAHQNTANRSASRQSTASSVNLLVIKSLSRKLVVGLRCGLTVLPLPRPALPNGKRALTERERRIASVPMSLDRRVVFHRSMTTCTSRSRLALAVCGLAIASTLVPAPVASARVDAAISGRYLALGDSIPLGFTPALEDPWSVDRMVGYPEVIDRLPRVRTTNFSCPGQTAQALISKRAPDNGCFEMRAEAPSMGIELLHTDYRGTQLDAARATIKASGVPTLISIQGGGNEVSMCADRANVERCVRAVLPAITQSLRTTAVQLHMVAPRAHIVLVGYHLPPGLEGPIGLVNRAIERAAQQADVAYADTATAFTHLARHHDGDVCAAGLLATYPDGSCDLHPSAKGQQVYADVVLAAAGFDR